MASIVDNNFMKSWQRLLQELEMARNYHLPYMLIGLGGTFRNPLLDYLLPSLIYVKLVGILDDALKFYIQHHGLNVPKKKYENSLHGRIELLNEHGLIANYCSLRKIKILRNNLAHDVSMATDWATLDTDLDTIENELQNLDFVGDRPKYEYFGERSAMHASDDPEVARSQDYQFGVKYKNRVTLRFSFTQNYY